MKKHIISAGSNCHTAYWLKQTGLQQDSYPFDWLLSFSHLGLDYCIDNIESRFEYFLQDLRLDHRGHVVAARYPRTQLFHHPDLLSEDEAQRAAESDKLLRRVARLQAALSTDWLTFVYCFDVRPASLTAPALAQFDASAKRLLALVPQGELHVYFLHDGELTDIAQHALARHERLSVSTYQRDATVHKTWGTCPAFLQEWAEQQSVVNA